MCVASGRDLDKLRFQWRDLFGAGHIPNRGGIRNAGLFALFLELRMQVNREFQKFPVCAVSLPVRIGRVRVGRVILLWLQKFSGAALLKLDSVHLAIMRNGFDQIMGDLHLTHMVAADFSNYIRFFIYRRILPTFFNISGFLPTDLRPFSSGHS